MHGMQNIHKQNQTTFHQFILYVYASFVGCEPWSFNCHLSKEQKTKCFNREGMIVLDEVKKLHWKHQEDAKQ